MIRVIISLYAATATYKLIIEFRPKTSGSLFDTFETAPFLFTELIIKDITIKFQKTSFSWNKRIY